MGADIHIYVEKKLRNGRWACVRDLNQSIEAAGIYTRMEGMEAMKGGYWMLTARNYHFFAALAGVRGEGPAPKGLPDDVSDLVLEEHVAWGSDAHSASWATPLEFMETWLKANDGKRAILSKYVQKRITDGTYAAVSQFMREMCSISIEQWSGEEGNIEDYRFVFWFDN